VPSGWDHINRQRYKSQAKSQGDGAANGLAGKKGDGAKGGVADEEGAAPGAPGGKAQGKILKSLVADPLVVLAPLPDDALGGTHVFGIRCGLVLVKINRMAVAASFVHLPAVLGFVACGQ
jgi:hypothetical protein